MYREIKKTVHSPRTATRPVTCLRDRRQTSDELFQLRDAAPARTAAVECDVTVDCQLCCIEVE